LAQIYNQECRIVGLLHPDPARPFSIDYFTSIPFIRLRDWPPIENKLNTEWVIANPSAAQFYHCPVEFTEGELRQK